MEKARPMSEIQPVNTTYEPFSREPEYVEANRAFIERQDLSGVDRFLDLACGTATVSELLLAASPRAHLNGIDLDPQQIELATAHLQSLGYTVRHGHELTDDYVNDKPVCVLAVGSADELPFPDASFDCVTIANAIHMMPDRDKFLAAVSRVLKPGGVFGFNSSFYAGTFPEGTERWYQRWLQEALTAVDRMNQQREAAGQPRIRRVRGKTRSAFKNRWLNADEWTRALESHGLKPHDVHQRVVMMDRRCMRAVGAYGGLAEVLMSGYPVEVASQALQEAVDPAFDAIGGDAIPKNWLEVWATKG